MAANLQVCERAAEKGEVRLVVGKSMIAGEPQYDTIRRHNIEEIQAFDDGGNECSVSLLVNLLLLAPRNVRIPRQELNMIIQTKLLDSGVAIPTDGGQDAGRLHFNKS